MNDEELWQKISPKVSAMSLFEVDFPGGGGGGGGGGTLFFSAYVGSHPASTVHPKKISGISSTPNFSNPKKYPNSVP